MEVSNQTPTILNELVRRADLVVTDNTADFTPSPGVPVFLSSAAPPSAAESLNPLFAGVILTPTSEIDLPAVRAVLTPKLLLIRATVTDTLASNFGPSIDGVRLENFLTEPETPLSRFPDEARWRRDLDALARLSANPNLVVLTSTRLGQNEGDGSVSADRWLGYTLSSFLLAANGAHTFFGIESALTPQTMDSSLYNLEIGTPMGGAFAQAGVFQRRFTRGLVLVNPSNETRAVVLSRKYVDGFGTRYDSVEMKPHTGMILLETE